MKNLSWYLLIILIFISIPTATVALVDKVNENFGYISYCAEDLPISENITEMCKCSGSGKITSADGIFQRDCPCITSGKECKCNHTKKPEISNKDSDCDIIKSMGPAYRKFLPKQKGKELWCLKVVTKDGKNWCAPCVSLEHEFVKMERTSWKIDKKGDLTSVGDFHIRVIDFDKFEGFPSYFFQVERDKDGNIKMDGDMQKESLSLPTTVMFEDGKVKTVHVGFLNSFGLLKLYEGKPLVKGVDDVPTN